MVFPAQHPLVLRGDQTVELVFLRSPAELPIESQISASMLRKKRIMDCCCDLRFRRRLWLVEICTSSKFERFSLCWIIVIKICFQLHGRPSQMTEARGDVLGVSG